MSMNFEFMPWVPLAVAVAGGVASIFSMLSLTLARRTRRASAKRALKKLSTEVLTIEQQMRDILHDIRGINESYKGEKSEFDDKSKEALVRILHKLNFMKENQIKSIESLKESLSRSFDIELNRIDNSISNNLELTNEIIEETHSLIAASKSKL